MRVRLEQGGATVALDGQPLARGGEAAIYALPGQTGLLAKVYHQPTPEHGDKLTAMIANPPDDPTARQGHTSIAWPVQRLLAEDASRCVGFLMPRVDKVQSLFEVYNPKSRLQTWPLFHYGYLLRTARNLSIAVRALHARGYVLGDLNESNVLVSGQTLVTVVDTDSFQTRAGDRVFRCPVGKPEYVAPEIQNASFAEIDRTPEQDAFALAVLIFQLLMQGTHPFAGRFTGQGEPEPLARRIAAGHWPYAQARTGPFAPNPTAPPWAVLPPQVRDLMRLCFEEGHEKPAARPDAGRWQKALAAADGELIACPTNGQHRYHKSLPGCPWCELASRQGRDPFPSKDKVQARTAGAPSGSSLGGVSVPKSKPTGSGPPPLPPPLPSPLPPPLPSQKKPVKRKRQAVALSYALTPWPYVIAGGVAALGVLIWLIASNTRPTPHPFPPKTAVAQTPGAADPSGATTPVSGDPFPPTAVSDPGPVGTTSPPTDPLPGPGDNRIGDIRDFIGHSDRVSGVALAPKGDRAVSGGFDGMLRLWDVKSGSEIWHIQAQPDRVLCVAISPDGRFALAGGREPDVRMYDLDFLKEVMTFKGHTDDVRGVAFSPDGRHVLSGGDDQTARWWDASTGKLVAPLDLGSGVMCVALSSDGRRAAAGCVDGTIHVWFVAGEPLPRRLTGHKEAVHSVAFAPAGAEILSAGEDGTIRLWDSASGVELRQFLGHPDAVRGAAFTPDGLGVLSCGDNGTVRLWNAETGTEVTKFETPGQFPVTSVAFGADSRRAVTGGNDNLVRLWSLPDPTAPPGPPANPGPVAVIPPVKEPTKPADPDPANPDGQLKCFDAHKDAVKCVAYSADGRRVLTGCEDGQVYLWDVEKGEEMVCQEVHAGAVTCVAFSADGDRAASGGADNVVRLWSVKDGSLLRSASDLTDAPLALTFVNNGNGLIAATASGGPDPLNADARLDGVIMHWYTKTGAGPELNVYKRYKGPAYLLECAALYTNGQRALLAANVPQADGGTMPVAYIYDLPGGKILRQLLPETPLTAIRAVAVSANGARAVTTGADGDVRLWEVATGKQLATFVGHTAAVTCAAFSPTGDRLLTGDEDGSVRLWEAATGKELHHFNGHTSAVRGVAFSPDGTRAVSGGDDKTARVWDLSK